jgi:hypothetical protein
MTVRSMCDPTSQTGIYCFSLSIRRTDRLERPQSLTRTHLLAAKDGAAARRRIDREGGTVSDGSLPLYSPAARGLNLELLRAHLLLWLRPPLPAS